MWSAEIQYILDTPVPSCDKDVCVVYTHTDGSQEVAHYSMSIERFPDTEAIEAFVQSELDRLNAEEADTQGHA